MDDIYCRTCSLDAPPSAYYGKRVLGLAYIITIIYDFLYDNKASPHHTNTINFVF